MADPSHCPSAETLALLPDGRASQSSRLSLIVHLDGCTHCRRVLAYTGQYEAFQVSRSRDRTAFRVGVGLVDLRVAIEGGQRKDAVEALRALRSSSGAELDSSRWSSLEKAPPKCLARENFLDELGRLERELSSRLDPSALALGQWSEDSRLAAARGDRRYFAGTYFQQMLSTLDDEQDIAHQIRALAAAPPSRIDLQGLEKALYRLILLY